MKLVFPHRGELHPSDARLRKLAEFLGVDCEPLLLEKIECNHAEYLERVLPDRDSCFVVNPQVI
jgi:hypothetical protein